MPFIFQIGFNKTGTTSLHEFFKRNGIESKHYNKGNLANSMRLNKLKGCKLISKKYRKFTFFSDMECTYHKKTNLTVSKDIQKQMIANNDTINLASYYAHVDCYELLEKQYPRAKFILNTRNKQKWIESRKNHSGGHYLKRAKIIENLNDEQIINKWSKNYDEHHKNVLNYFKDKPEKLLVFDIEKDSIDKLIKFFPKLDLKADHWGVHKKHSNN